MPCKERQTGPAPGRYAGAAEGAGGNDWARSERIPTEEWTALLRLRCLCILLLRPLLPPTSVSAANEVTLTRSCSGRTAMGAVVSGIRSPTCTLAAPLAKLSCIRVCGTRVFVCTICAVLPADRFSFRSDSSASTDKVFRENWSSAFASTMPQIAQFCARPTVRRQRT